MNNGNYKIIDTDKWARKIHCSIFRNSLIPLYCISFNLDITNFYKEIKKKKYSTTLSLIYIITKCANSIENFRYRFENKEVVLYDNIDTSFTYLKKGSDLFMQVNVPFLNNFDDYISLANYTIANQAEYFISAPGNDVFIFSAIPWIDFNYISHTFSGNTECSSPIFDWGKITADNGRLSITLSVQVHHSFVDGIHLGKFYDMLQKELIEFK